MCLFPDAPNATKLQLKKDMRSHHRTRGTMLSIWFSFTVLSPNKIIKTPQKKSTVNGKKTITIVEEEKGFLEIVDVTPLSCS
jgi:hypothetical protein